MPNISPQSPNLQPSKHEAALLNKLLADSEISKTNDVFHDCYDDKILPGPASSALNSQSCSECGSSLEPDSAYINNLCWQCVTLDAISDIPSYKDNLSPNSLSPNNLHIHNSENCNVSDCDAHLPNPLPKAKPCAGCGAFVPLLSSTHCGHCLSLIFGRNNDIPVDHASAQSDNHSDGESEPPFFAQNSESDSKSDDCRIRRQQFFPQSNFEIYAAILLECAFSI